MPVSFSNIRPTSVTSNIVSLFLVRYLSVGIFFLNRPMNTYFRIIFLYVLLEKFTTCSSFHSMLVIGLPNVLLNIVYLIAFFFHFHSLRVQNNSKLFRSIRYEYSLPQSSFASNNSLNIGVCLSDDIIKSCHCELYIDYTAMLISSFSK